MAVSTLGRDQMKKLLPILLTSALSAMSQAAVITVFDDSAYVDTTNSSFAESDTLQASLTSFGYTFSTFTGDSAVAWNTALSGSDILLIPETEPNSAAGNNLEAAGAGSALRSFVSGGGTLISFADSASGVDSISASIFGFSLTNESAPSSWAISADGIAAGYSSPRAEPLIMTTEPPLPYFHWITGLVQFFYSAGTGSTQHPWVHVTTAG